MTDARNIAMLASPAISEYCRQARRLRHVHRDDPVVLHRALRELRPAKRVEARRVEPAAAFADAVAARLDGPVLRYSQRQHLLRLANRLGIARFEANLIIASVQHRGGAQIVHIQASAKRTAGQLVPLATFLAIQSTILFAVWRLLAG